MRYVPRPIDQSAAHSQRDHDVRHAVYGILGPDVRVAKAELPVQQVGNWCHAVDVVGPKLDKAMRPSTDYLAIVRPRYSQV
jgi:hypothetical protein